MSSKQEVGIQKGNIVRRLISIRETAVVLNVSTDSVRRLLEGGQLPSIWIRGRRLVPIDAVERLCKGE